MEPSILTEETAEELAEVISPELKPKSTSGGGPCLNPGGGPCVNPILKSSSMMIDEAGSSILSQGVSGVTLLSIGEQINDAGSAAPGNVTTTQPPSENEITNKEKIPDNEEATLKESFSAKL